jgi:predicted tellurium resistance membrane protein TerC
MSPNQSLPDSKKGEGMEVLLNPANLGSLLTLSVMEIVLGIDNIVFISILVAKLPAAQRERARKLGLLLALLMRIGLLFTINWIMKLQTELFHLRDLGLSGEMFDIGFSGKDLILLGGGLFLIGKATHEIYDKLEVAHEEEAQQSANARSFGSILIQIMILDIVFSLDSVITAVGMATEIEIMVAATIIAVGVMLIFAGTIGDFVNRHPSVKLLALSFLILIGVILVADGMGQHISKGYVYFAMAFSLGVELMNMRLRQKNQKPVTLHNKFEQAGKDSPPAS